MTDFLCCPLPLYADLTADLERVLADRRTSKLTRDNAQRSLNAINDLNDAVSAVRHRAREAGKAQEAADELRALLKQRQQDLVVANGFKTAYDKLREEFDNLEANIEAETAKRASAALAEVRKQNADLLACGQQLSMQISAASRDNHFTGARTYVLAFLLGAGLTALGAFIGVAVYLN